MCTSKSTKYLFTLLLLLLSGSLLFGVTVNDLEIRTPSARTAAIGGVHVALADDLTTLFANPAGFRSVKPQLSVAEITMGVSGPIFDIASLMLSGESTDDLLADPDVQDLLRGIYAGLNLLGPISFGYVGNGLGFGIFNESSITFSGAGTVPKVTTNIEEEFIFAGGYAFRIPLPHTWNSTFDAGILLKAFINTTSSSTKDILDLMDVFSDTVALIMNEPFFLSMGIGIDWGILYSYKEVFSAGLVGRNLPSPVQINEYSSFQGFLDNEAPAKSNDFLPIELSFGVMYNPPLRKLGRYINDLKLMLDYEDILDFLTHSETSTNPILHIGFGCEVDVLQILSLRAGFYQGLLSAGLGLNLSAFTFNMAMFGTELSTEPGMRPVYNLLLGLEFRY